MPTPPWTWTAVCATRCPASAAHSFATATSVDEIAQAILKGVAYANVHSTKWPGGEIRGQLTY